MGEKISRGDNRIDFIWVLLLTPPSIIPLATTSHGGAGGSLAFMKRLLKKPPFREGPKNPLVIHQLKTCTESVE